MREVDLDGGQGQWSAHHGTGHCPVACTVHPALVRAAHHCVVQGPLDRAYPHTDIPSHCAHTLVQVGGPVVCGGAMHVRCKGGVSPMGGGLSGPYCGSHTDQEPS